MSKKNPTIPASDCLRLIRYISIIPEEDQPALASLLAHVKNGTLSPHDMVPKQKDVNPDQAAELSRLGCSLFSDLNPEYQKVIIDVMKSAGSIQPSDASRRIGARLEELRGDRCLEFVAAAIGITPYSLAMYECGCRMPHDEIKARIAAYYGQTVSSLFGDEENIGNPALAHLVFSNYPTIDAFAAAIGWTAKKASRVIANRAPLRQKEMQQIINHFQVKPENVAPLFFGTMFA